jgi:hypothetical protein
MDGIPRPESAGRMAFRTLNLHHGQHQNLPTQVRLIMEPYRISFHPPEFYDRIMAFNQQNSRKKPNKGFYWHRPFLNMML